MQTLAKYATGNATLLAMLAAVLLAGCASTQAPTVQVAVSAAAVVKADDAGGDEIAPLEMQIARDKMERARVAMTAKNFDLARRLAEEAQVDAQLAEAKSRTAQARETARELRENIRILREELNRNR